jgi:phosphoribosyl 1,2-cyclic phosphodiesterase
MRVTFWGVRGTFPATGATFARYGGDTMCVEVECGATRVVLDAGSGLRALGAHLRMHDKSTLTHIVLSHLHLDHIIGLPSFAPLWREESCIVLHAAAECVATNEDALFSVLRPPLFPIDAGELPAAIGVEEFVLGGSFAPEPGVVVRTLALSHQGPCAAIVLQWQGRKLCYVTDHEHGDREADDRLTLAVEGADLLIYDATFTDAELAGRRGWGHSTWEEGVRLKRRAGVKLLALAHHDPDRSDSALDALAEGAAAVEPNVFFARQGLSIGL